MAIQIVRAVPSDAAEIIAFIKQVGGESDNLSFGPEGLPFTAESEAALIADLEGSGDSLMLLAKDNGKIVGDANLNRMRRRMKHRGGLSLVVAKSHWDQGIGGQLLCGMIDFAKEHDFDILDLEVRADNLRAIHLYEKHGFQKLGTHPGYFKIDGKWIDFHWMYLPLKDSFSCKTP